MRVNRGFTRQRIRFKGLCDNLSSRVRARFQPCRKQHNINAASAAEVEFRDL